jgi:DUF1680 family protein
MGGFKSYQDPEGFTCCVGTGMENHSKYGRNIFFKNEAELYVSQFIAAEVNWKEKGVKVKQVTKFPEEQGTTIEIESDTPQEFTLQIRYPYWAEKGIEIRVNGKKKEIDQKPGSFIGLKREWVSGDKVEVSIPFTLRLETMPDDENRVAVLYGPLVMAGELGPEDDPAAENPDYVPVLRTEERDPNLWLSPVENAVNTFKVAEEVAHPRGFTLIPFYAMHEHRYSVYWDMFDEVRWRQKESEQAAS